MYIFELLAAFLMSARASRIAQTLRSTSLASLLACNDCSDGMSGSGTDSGTLTQLDFLPACC
jgi:hypothetical protein